MKKHLTLQGQRKGCRPLNWILGVLPRHLKIPRPRPSFQPLKQTKEAEKGSLKCPDLHCPETSVFRIRPEPWEQNKEWRLEKLEKKQHWTMMNYDELWIIELYWTYWFSLNILWSKQNTSKYWKSWQHRGKMRTSHPSQETNSWACHGNLHIENTFRFEIIEINHRPRLWWRFTRTLASSLDCTCILRDLKKSLDQSWNQQTKADHASNSNRKMVDQSPSRSFCSQGTSGWVLHQALKSWACLSRAWNSNTIPSRKNVKN